MRPPFAGMPPQAGINFEHTPPVGPGGEALRPYPGGGRGGTGYAGSATLAKGQGWYGAASTGGRLIPGMGTGPLTGGVFPRFSVHVTESISDLNRLSYGLYIELLQELRAEARETSRWVRHVKLNRQHRSGKSTQKSVAGGLVSGSTVKLKHKRYYGYPPGPLGARPDAWNDDLPLLARTPNKEGRHLYQTVQARLYVADGQAITPSHLRTGPSMPPSSTDFFTIRMAAGSSARTYNDEERQARSVPYAGIHEYGGRSGKGHKVQIPARPYLRPASLRFWHKSQVRVSEWLRGFNNLRPRTRTVKQWDAEKSRYQRLSGEL